MTSFGRLWPLRNSIESADYDERAFFSRIPLQRYWQRRRHRIITTCARGAGHTLDVGCGSSVILQSLNDAVGLDILAIKFATCDDMVFPLYRARSWRCPSAKQASAALFILPALFIVIGGLAILRIRDLVDILLG